MSFVAIHRSEDGHVERLNSPEEVLHRHQERTGLLWVHISRIDQDDALLLDDVFAFHPLAVEDCLSDRYQRPRVDDYEDHLFMLLHGIDFAAAGDEIATSELNLFLGPNYVVTSSTREMAPIDHLAATSHEHPQILARGADMLAYAIVDALVDSVLPTVDRMGEVTDDIEEQVLESPRPELLEAVIRLKRSILRLHRAMSPQRDVLYRVSRGDYPVIARESTLFFRDVYDHLVRIEDLVAGLRERAEFVVSTYHSAISVRQNETMRQLTFVASIFLPLTLLAGIYGMNFHNMPELGWEYAYFVVIGFMAVAILAGTWWLWGRAWLDWSRRRTRGVLSLRLEPPLVRETLHEAARLRSRLLEAAQRVRRTNGK
jgi:magnesium transporter